MPGNELVLLDQAIADWQSEQSEPIADDKAFEIIACTQALRDRDVSSDEIAEGVVGGGDDGAIDGVYTFLGDTLLTEDSEALQELPANKLSVGTTLTLVLVQAKRTEAFTETAIDLVADSTRRLLDLAQSEEDLSAIYSTAVIERIGFFRSALRKFGARHLKLRIEFHYATRGATAGMHAKVKRKARDLEVQFDQTLVKAEGAVTFLGAKELWERISTLPTYTVNLSVEEYSTSGNSHVALVSLRDYMDFLRDDDGALRRHIFDWNVRDYQGDVEVNREIRESVLDASLPEFWWLNNGVTIVCSEVSITAKTFALDNVQVVNGLQTSQTIFNALESAASDHSALDRKVLVRILATGDDTRTRDQVIRATNRQTSVPAASLRATDEIQRKIEAYFVSHDWYYDRRKNFYRNQGKAASRIVGIPLLAQAVMAMGLSRPDDSRARPSSLLKRDSVYGTVFSESLPLPVYLWLAKTQKSVDAFLLTDVAVASASERTNLRFHLAMLATAVLFGARVYNPSQLAKVAGENAELDKGLLSDSLATLRTAFTKVQGKSGGSLDKIAKGPEFVKYLLDEVLPQLIASRPVQSETSPSQSKS
ncbi:AIPR family protein [Promicromonospora iranensis]|uniref:Abortive phage infection protein C-terminal domain-containing protein n=1 Tax=Promicromonospora iranensis TaxID=1105144 RepID=A0ABU2CS65_9MICO|nr:AIPR family protein [Promicromonospora iranensis]MDR7384187.1 hypothetical protein [Promicromonospora iranensis]